MIITEDQKMLLTFFILLTIIQFIGIIKSFINAKIGDYSWTHYNKYFITEIGRAHV